MPVGSRLVHESQLFGSIFGYLDSETILRGFIALKGNSLDLKNSMSVVYSIKSCEAAASRPSRNILCFIG